MSSVTTKRAYNSSRRAAQAAQTRADVLAAAIECFSESGWSGTTLNAVAERAGVAVETIYNGFGTKKRLLCEAMDVAVVGDAEPIPLAERPEWAAMRRGNRATRLATGIALQAEIHERSARVWRCIAEASNADAEIAAFRDDGEARRHSDTQIAFEIIFGKPINGPMFDVLFALLGPDTYLTLTEDRGYSRAEYEAAIAQAALKIAG